MSREYPQLFITCIGYREKIVLEDAIVDAIAAEQDTIRRLERGERVPTKGGHDAHWFIATGQDRISDLEELKTVIKGATLCIPEGG